MKQMHTAAAMLVGPQVKEGAKVAREGPKAAKDPVALCVAGAVCRSREGEGKREKNGAGSE